MVKVDKTLMAILVAGTGVLGVATLIPGPKSETVTTRQVFLNSGAQGNRDIRYERTGRREDTILPVRIVTAIGSSETYGDNKFPYKVEIGGDYPITGSGWDYNEDGKFDRVEKRDPSDDFMLSDLEKELYRVRDMVGDNPDNVFRIKQFGPRP